VGLFLQPWSPHGATARKLPREFSDKIWSEQSLWRLQTKNIKDTVQLTGIQGSADDELLVLRRMLVLLATIC